MTDDDECLERADRLLREGVAGDRGLIASMIYEAVTFERDRTLKIAAGMMTTPAYKQFERQVKSGAAEAWAKK